MNCNQFQRRLNWLLDQRLPTRDDPTLIHHTSQCETCRDQLRSWCDIDNYWVHDDSVADQTAGRSAVDATLSDPLITDQPVSLKHTKSRALMPWSMVVAASILILVIGVGMVSVRGNRELLTRQTSPLALPETAAQPVNIFNDETSESSTESRSDPASIGQSANASKDRTTDPRETLNAGYAEFILAAVAGEPWKPDQWVLNPAPAVHKMTLGVAPIGRSMKRAMAILLVDPISPSMSTPPGTSIEASPETTQGKTSRLKLQTISIDPRLA